MASILTSNMVSATVEVSATTGRERDVSVSTPPRALTKVNSADGDPTVTISASDKAKLSKYGVVS